MEEQDSRSWAYMLIIHSETSLAQTFKMRIQLKEIFNKNISWAKTNDNGEHKRKKNIAPRIVYYSISFTSIGFAN